ncbi:hypothetical protein EOE67_01850 [Rheinheimera riviphila]|uniref:Tetratricopeptide repeat protein n=1 Tax=Rheinheimera riviphila TaxID=1834037 RepID=A0A437R5L1_9GAMM|nr:hypothetical protein [Rheinheimera riviphila]RVU41957.1 hypothetical protein EOE67_01850 [Rheinheimera riviphila]
MKTVLKKVMVLSVVSSISCMATAAGLSHPKEPGQLPTGKDIFANEDKVVGSFYAAGDKQGLLDQITKLNQLLSSDKAISKADARYYLALSSYRLGLVDYKNAKTHLQKCIDETNGIVTTDAQYTEAYILTAACSNSLIGNMPERTMELSLAGRTALQRAAELEPANPRLLYIQAVTALYTPPQFGGGLPRASTLLEQSIQQFEAKAADKTKAYPRWGLDEAYVWTGVIFSVNGKNTEAIAALEKSLDVSQSSWVKTQLLPTLKRGSSIGPHFGLQLSN